MPAPVFLEFSVIEDLHEDSLSLYGGSPGLRDRHLVESALAAAINTYYYAAGDLFDIAAAYAFHLAQAQAFLDGNKRTAAGAALMFLQANGVVKRPPGDAIYDALIAMAEKRLDEAGMAQVFRRAALSAS